MASKTKLSKEILTKINHRLLIKEDNDLVQLINQGHQGIAFQMDVDGQSFLVKRTNQASPLAGRISQYFINHEYKIYQRLESIIGIPKCYGLSEDGSLILEFIDGHSYREKERTLEGRDQFFADLLTLILTIHAGGVSHGDLKRKDNILIGENNQPYLIDFGTAMTLNPKDQFIKRWLYNFSKQTDLNAWIKHKYSRQYGRIEEDDLVYYSSSKMDKLVRLTRRFWRTLTFRQFRKKRGQQKK